MNMNKIRNVHIAFTQSGVSLVELMVALTVGLFLLGGVLATYVSSKQTYQQSDAMGRLQENARFAFQQLSRDIRGGGYAGCGGSGVTLTNLLNTTGTSDDKVASFAWDFTRSAVEGYEATGTGTWSSAATGTAAVSLAATDVAPSVVSGTDVVTIRGPDSIPIRIVGQPVSNESGASCVFTSDLKIDPEPVPTSPRIATGDTVMVTDCKTQVTFLVTDYNGTTGVVKHAVGGAEALRNTSANLGACVVTGDLTAISAKSYYIRANPAGVRSLYRATAGASAGGDPEMNPSEIVEGVQDLQIEYGEDTDNDWLPDAYVAADAVTNWARVVSVRVSLLMRSVEDNVVTAPQTYTYRGASTTAADHRLYQVFTTTIALRSRIL